MALLLFIDADESRLRNVLEALRGDRHRCRSVAAGPRVREAVKRIRPDLIVVGLDALESTRALIGQLRQERRTETLPILLSGDATLEAVAVACLAGGATDWIALPLHPGGFRSGGK